MKDYLKEYHMQLLVKGPLFIGSGQELMKKEYVYDRGNKRIIVPALDKLYAYLQSRHLHHEYEKFILNDRYGDLGRWMREQGISLQDSDKWQKYELDCGDAVFEKGKTMQVMQCMKDAYGNPYIPGSSLKGMLRTILLGYCMEKENEKFSRLADEMYREAGQGGKRTSYLLRPMKNIEVEAFHKLELPQTRKQDMVNDCLSGLIVSDSQPLSLDVLTLCQKVDYHVDGREVRLPLLRECIKPGTVIDFTLTIDETKCPYGIKEIQTAIAMFADIYYQYFSGKFPKIQKSEQDTVWLGGGAGYVSKTINYPLYRESGVRMAQMIFENTVSPKHKHRLDARLGVSPHILKLTIYEGKRYQFGECKLQLA
ncbi:MAG: type III-A CRISPR-associated RAMP protein Csm5 [Lachnospiraceae bacterium]|nr:type III-A CRISPR-associated RAMP protein Csm5 [Lachnospiraceae bacterium]